MDLHESVDQLCLCRKKGTRLDMSAEIQLAKESQREIDRCVFERVEGVEGCLLHQLVRHDSLFVICEDKL